MAGLETAFEEVVVGCGPCGELRYPSYVEANGWRFPGVSAVLTMAMQHVLLVACGSCEQLRLASCMKANG